MTSGGGEQHHEVLVGSLEAPHSIPGRESQLAAQRFAQAAVLAHNHNQVDVGCALHQMSVSALRDPGVLTGHGVPDVVEGRKRRLAHWRAHIVL
eukprot:7389863-Prymnesium_polylepis.2